MDSTTPIKLAFRTKKLPPNSVFVPRVLDKKSWSASTDDATVEEQAEEEVFVEDEEGPSGAEVISQLPQHLLSEDEVFVEEEEEPSGAEEKTQLPQHLLSEEKVFVEVEEGRSKEITQLLQHLPLDEQKIKPIPRRVSKIPRMAPVQIRKADLETKVDLKTPKVGLNNFQHEVDSTLLHTSHFSNRLQLDGGSISELEKPEEKISAVENYELRHPDKLSVVTTTENDQQAFEIVALSEVLVFFPPETVKVSNPANIRKELVDDDVEYEDNSEINYFQVLRKDYEVKYQQDGQHIDHQQLKAVETKIERYKNEVAVLDRKIRLNNAAHCIQSMTRLHQYRVQRARVLAASDRSHTALSLAYMESSTVSWETGSEMSDSNFDIDLSDYDMLVNDMRLSVAGEYGDVMDTPVSVDTRGASASLMEMQSASLFQAVYRGYKGRVKMKLVKEMRRAADSRTSTEAALTTQLSQIEAVMRTELQRLEKMQVQQAFSDLESRMRAEQQQLMANAEAAKAEGESVIVALQLKLRTLELREQLQDLKQTVTVEFGISESHKGPTHKKTKKQRKREARLHQAALYIQCMVRMQQARTKQRLQQDLRQWMNVLENFQQRKQDMERNLISADQVIADYCAYQERCTTMEELEENEVILKRLRECKRVIKHDLVQTISEIAGITEIISEHEVTSRHNREQHGDGKSHESDCIGFRKCIRKKPLYIARGDY